MYAACRKQGGKEVLQGLLVLKVKDGEDGLGGVGMMIKEELCHQVMEVRRKGDTIMVE